MNIRQIPIPIAHIPIAISFKTTKTGMEDNINIIPEINPIMNKAIFE